MLRCGCPVLYVHYLCESSPVYVPCPIPDPVPLSCSLVAPTRSRCRACAKTVGTCLARAVAVIGAKARPASRAEKEKQAHKTRLVAFRFHFLSSLLFLPLPTPPPLSPNPRCLSISPLPPVRSSQSPQGNHLPGLHRLCSRLSVCKLFIFFSCLDLSICCARLTACTAGRYLATICSPATTSLPTKGSRNSPQTRDPLPEPEDHHHPAPTSSL